MRSGISLREDFDGERLRGLARQTKDAAQVGLPSFRAPTPAYSQKKNRTTGEPNAPVIFVSLDEPRKS